MIIHLTGADTYRSAKRLAELRAAFIAKHDPAGLNTVTIDGGEASLAEIQNGLRATGFFASKRFVAIDRFAAHGDCTPDALLDLLQPVAATGYDVIVVVREISDSAPAKSATKKRTKKTSVELHIPQAKLETFPALTPAEAATWVQREVTRRQGKIIPAAAQRLVALCAADTWKLAAEMEKLSLYTAGQPITVHDVEAMVVGEANQDIFALTDAIGQRQTGRALDLLHRELAAGTNPFALIAALAHHIRNLWFVSEGLRRGLRAAEIADEYGLHPYVAQKAIAQSQTFPPTELQRLHHRLLHVDQALKTSPLDAETLLNLLVVLT